MTMLGIVKTRVLRQACWGNASSAIPDDVQFHQVKGVTIGREPSVKGIQRDSAATLKHGIHSSPERKAKVGAALRGNTTSKGVDDHGSEDTREDDVSTSRAAETSSAVPDLRAGAPLGSPLGQLLRSGRVP